MSIAALCHGSKDTETEGCTARAEGIMKMECVSTTAFYSAVKKSEIMKWVGKQKGMENMILSEKEKQTPQDLTHMWVLA